jgi:hypothetical protein
MINLLAQVATDPVQKRCFSRRTMRALGILRSQK